MPSQKRPWCIPNSKDLIIFKVSKSLGKNAGAFFVYKGFGGALAFNGNIGNWETSSVTDMDYMFFNAPAFNQNLSGWCVTEIPTKPSGFDTDATSWTLPDSRPEWGICPP